MRTGYALAAILIAVGPAQGGTATRAEFGRTASGERVEAVTLVAGRYRATIISYGAALQAMHVPDRAGVVADVTLGYPTLDGYLAKSEYFGATVGRVANRVARGRFTLDGRAYQTPVNNGPHALHGGTKGFDKVVWRVTGVTGGATPRVTLRYVSPDGDQGYPGTLTTDATYSLSEAGTLGVEYRATTDRPTVVALSNHAYWNLAGEGAATGAMDHLLTIPAEDFNPVDATLIPVGGFKSVAGTPLDFRRATPVGARVRDGDAQLRHGRGYDHNWAVARAVSPGVRLLARVEHPGSGRVLEVHSNQPSIQFYSGNFLDGTVVGKAGKLYRQGDTVVLEPQMPPDTVNQPDLGSIRLDPGQTYVNRIEFRFSTGAAQ